MKAQKKITAVFVFFIAGFLSAQKIDVKWSALQHYDNKEDGFFSYFLGGNSKTIYAMFANRTWGTRKERFKFVAFSADSMKKVADVTVIDRRNPEERAKYEGLRYYKSLVFENVIYVFWKKEDREKEELYVQSFDAKLNPVNKLKKIYELNSGRHMTKRAELFVMGNPKNSAKMIIGGELAAEKEESVRIEYKVLNEDFSFAGAGQVTLPVKVMWRSGYLTGGYEFGEDGNLHIRNKVYMPYEERKNLKRGESSVYTIYSIVDVENNSIRSYPLKFDNKNIFETGIKIDKEVVKIFGFFSDLTKDSRGENTHGIFYCIVNSKSQELEQLNFTYFTASQLDLLFSGDKEDRYNYSGRRNSRGQNEALAPTYGIEEVQSIDKDHLVLFCSIMIDLAWTTCDNQGRNCRTVYECHKRNVTAFKLDKTGNIVWASNLDRAIVYSGNGIKDVSVVCPDSKTFYVIYGSSYSPFGNKKTYSTRKSSKERLNTLEYATFDYATGKFRKDEYVLNAPDAKKADRKHISPLAVQVVDNKFYVNSTNTRLKPYAVATCIACFPVGYFLMLGGNAHEGRGYLGTIATGK